MSRRARTQLPDAADVQPGPDGVRRLKMGHLVIELLPIPSTCLYCDGPGMLYPDPFPVGTAICDCCSYPGCPHRPPVAVYGPDPKFGGDDV